MRKIKPVDRQIFGFSKMMLFLFMSVDSHQKRIYRFSSGHFMRVAMTYDHVRLLLVGDGPERENLETQVKHMNIESKYFLPG